MKYLKYVEMVDSGRSDILSLVNISLTKQKQMKAILIFEESKVDIAAI